MNIIMNLVKLALALVLCEMMVSYFLKRTFVGRLIVSIVVTALKLLQVTFKFGSKGCKVLLKETKKMQKKPVKKVFHKNVIDFDKKKRA